MPLKIALTGATGFVGRAVVSALMAKSFQVSALVRDSARAEVNSNVRQVQGDLQNSVLEIILLFEALTNAKKSRCRSPVGTRMAWGRVPAA